MASHYNSQDLNLGWTWGFEERGRSDLASEFEDVLMRKGDSERPRSRSIESAQKDEKKPREQRGCRCVVADASKDLEALTR